ncbi:MAG: ribosome small subunit-dependent GTPase A [Pseudooceanicola sp.]
MSEPSTSPTKISLRDLGWSAHFLSQLDTDEVESLRPARLAEVQRDRVIGWDDDGAHALILPPDIAAGDLAVGDWVVFDPETKRVVRGLDRKTELNRRASGHEARAQLIAANIDTLFVTTSCNDDFSLPRLERALALAYEADIEPVILITKADLTDTPDAYADKARTAARDVEVIVLNAKSPDAVALLDPWCGAGQTVALIGMSGTGKSTLANALCGTEQATGDIREDDAKGRHTTTARSLHRTRAGGWLIDTPGMREMGVFDSAAGIDAVFAEITDLTAHCKFRDCTHEHEPGCAVQAAIAAGDLDATRLTRWRKLRDEDRRSTETIAQSRSRGRNLTKYYKTTQAAGRRFKSDD